MSYRILKISSLYKSFLQSYYANNPDIRYKSYQEQYRHLNSQGAGYSDYFIKELNKKGYEGWEIVHNAKPLQHTWAKEKGLAGKDILLNQLMDFRPEIVFIQASSNFSASYIEKIREKVKSIKLLIGHCCAPYTRENIESFRKYDLILTCSEKFVKEFKDQGLKTYLFLHAIDKDQISKINFEKKKINELIFIGSLLQRSEFHQERINYIEDLLKFNIPLKVYGFVEYDRGLILRSKQAVYILNRILKALKLSKVIQSIEPLAKTNLLKEFPVRSNYSKELLSNITQKELFGIDMLQTLADYSVAFNLHAQVAGDFAANVRLFEATGAGTALLTDEKKNITKLFEADKEIVTFSNTNECIEKAKYLINNPKIALSIGRAGQLRTLNDHSVEKRAEQLDQIIHENL